MIRHLSRRIPGLCLLPYHCFFCTFYTDAIIAGMCNTLQSPWHRCWILTCRILHTWPYFTSSSAGAAFPSSFLFPFFIKSTVKLFFFALHWALTICAFTCISRFQLIQDIRIFVAHKLNQYVLCTRKSNYADTSVWSQPVNTERKTFLGLHGNP